MPQDNRSDPQDLRFASARPQRASRRPRRRAAPAPRRRRTWTIVAMAILAFAALLALATLQASGAFRSDTRATIQPQKFYTGSTSYYAYIQPWGAKDGTLGDLLSGRADRMWIDGYSFPDNTRIDWLWPPFGPGNGVGVWGYNHIAYGNYDNGQPAVPVKPMLVRDMSALAATVDWDGDNRLGSANLLLEFYLRSDPDDSESKVIEVGWFLHLPRQSARFMAQSKQIGTYVDRRGRSWTVAMGEKFCMFALADGGDVKGQPVDMLAALQWLKGKGLVDDRLWLTGLAVGAEPLKGAGHFEIRHFSVDWK